MRIALALCLAAALAALAPSAHAEDFTFNVPVRVENMRFAESGIITCIVTADGPRVVRSRDQTFPITEGSFRDTLTVTVNLPAGERRDAFTRYSCTIYVNFRPSGGALVNGGDFGPPRFIVEYPSRTGQAIASSNMTVGATIPR